jgi:2-methylaconitate cis-trans-isomerase PrpF
VVNEVAKPAEGQKLIKIGHPGGIIDVEAEVEQTEKNKFKLVSASYSRTARRIMDGHVYVPVNVLK